MGPDPSVEVGIFSNSGTTPGERFDIGITGGIQIGLGVDASVGAETGFVQGRAENLSGASVNVNVGALAGSVTGTALLDSLPLRRGSPPPSVTALGVAVAYEISPLPVSGSATFGVGGKIGTGDLLDAFNALTRFVTENSTSIDSEVVPYCWTVWRRS